MLEILDSEYIKLARAKGVSERDVIWKHALKNALIPPLTLAALIFVGFLTGTIIVETVFDTKTNTFQEVVKYGFLDKHPKNDKLHCIRTFNFFAPYKDESKLVGEAPLNLIEEINE